MSYVVVGGVCLMIGAMLGMLVVALCSAGKCEDCHLAHKDRNNKEENAE